MRKTALIAFSVLLIGIRCFPEDPTPALGSIRGDVFTRDAGGERSVLPATQVTLHGPVAKETQSDQRGAYSFDSIPPGKYVLEARAPGLSATLEVEVSPGATAAAPLELNVVAVSSMVTVTASDPAPIAESAQSTTITQKTVEAAPNQNEKFESLLPLVPGVVRGPDGRINMKGAQSTQSGLASELGQRNRSCNGRTSHQPADRRGFLRPGDFQPLRP